jgi:phenylacetate-CoA ligase
MNLLNIIRSGLWRGRLYVKGGVLDNQETLSDSQYLNTDALKELQETRLRRLIQHAARHTAFYPSRFRECGLVENGNVHLDEFQSLPLLDKEDLRSRTETLRSDDLGTRNWRYNTSGGSTGEPVQFIQDDTYTRWALAVKRLFNDWTGYRLGQPRIKLWGSERDLLVGNATLKTTVRRWVRNEYPLNAFQMGEAEMRRFVDRINEVQPIQILAYVESAFELAKFIKQEGLEVHSPQAVMTSAGTLHDHMRETIRETFQAPVFNRYGSREVGDIACGCEAHEGLHVSAPTHYVEILRPDGTPTEPGEVGEIVVTLLTNYAMPLIRYRIGDMGAWAESACVCGRSWPLLKEVTGRVTDVFIRSDGKRIDGRLFNTFLWEHDFVEKYQVIQDSVNSITVKISCNSKQTDAKTKYKKEIGQIRKNIKSVMGGGCRVVFQFQEDIRPTDSGKYRYTISRVNRERPGTAQ